MVLKQNKTDEIALGAGALDYAPGRTTVVFAVSVDYIIVLIFETITNVIVFDLIKKFLVLS